MTNQEQLSQMLESRKWFLLNVRCLKKRFVIKYTPAVYELIRGELIAYWISYKCYGIGIIKSYNSKTSSAEVLPVHPQSQIFGSKAIVFYRNIMGIFREAKT